MQISETASEIVKEDWPSFGLESDIRPALAAALAAGKSSALVTLHRAIGGAPRGVGAQMLVTRDGLSGYLSGGCIEADVTEHALAVLRDGEPRRLAYGEGGPVDIRLPCGGRIDLLVERLSHDDAAAIRLLELSARREPALWLSDGRTRACLPQPDGAVGWVTALPGSRREAAGLSDGDGCGEVIRRLYEPRQRLVVFGHDPTAMAMAILAHQTGMEVFLVRPKGPAAPPHPGVQYLRLSPSEALRRIRPDPWTAVALAMHQEEDDHEALVAALPSRAGYVGLLGSSRRLPGRKERLAQAGISREDIARLRAPIGLDVGGCGPWDIAIGVVAEILQAAHAERVQARGSAEAA